MADEKKLEDLPIKEQADGSVVIGDAEGQGGEDTAQGGADTVTGGADTIQGGDDDRLSGNDNELGDGEETGHANETAEEAELRRQRNRERRAQNKERRKDYIEQLRREISSRDELLQNAMQRLDAVEKRGQGADFAAIDNEIKKTAEAYNYFKQQVELGTKEQNGAVVADATEKMILAQTRYNQLAHAKKMAASQTAQPTPLDPRLKAHAEKWLSENSWYDVEAKDEDSAILKSIDARMAQEGWNPTTEAYWKELDSRKKKYLPHRANLVHNREKQAPRSPVAGSGRDNGASKGSGTYHLSAERVKALKEAGTWDDPKARADAIRRYQEYDKTASAAAR